IAASSLLSGRSALPDELVLEVFHGESSGGAIATALFTVLDQAGTRLVAPTAPAASSAVMSAAIAASQVVPAVNPVSAFAQSRSAGHAGAEAGLDLFLESLGTTPSPVAETLPQAFFAPVT